MKGTNKPIFFLATGIAGMVAASAIIGLALYQYVSLGLLVQMTQQYSLTLNQGLISSTQTGYLIIILSALPLAALSLWLTHRSVKRLRQLRAKRVR